MSRMQISFDFVLFIVRRVVVCGCLCVSDGVACLWQKFFLFVMSGSHASSGSSFREVLQAGLRLVVVQHATEGNKAAARRIYILLL